MHHVGATRRCTSGSPSPGKSDVGGVPGDALDNPEQDEEDGQLHQEWQTSTQRIDAVLLVERHQLLVHLLAIVLVPRLNRFEFGLQSLHLQHRARALER